MEFNCLPSYTLPPEKSRQNDTSCYKYRYNDDFTDVIEDAGNGYCDKYGWMNTTRPEFAIHIVWMASRTTFNGLYNTAYP